MQPFSIPIQNIGYTTFVSDCPVCFCSFMFVCPISHLGTQIINNDSLLIFFFFFFLPILFSYQHKAVVTALAGPWWRCMAAGKAGPPLNSLLWSFADFCFSCTPFPGTSRDQSAQSPQEGSKRLCNLDMKYQYQIPSDVKQASVGL